MSLFSFFINIKIWHIVLFYFFFIKSPIAHETSRLHFFINCLCLLVFDKCVLIFFWASDLLLNSKLLKHRYICRDWELSWAWLADNFKSGSTLVASLICPPLVYSMTDSCDAKFGHSPMNIKSWGDDDWIFHMQDSQPGNILFCICSQIVMKINVFILYRSEVQGV